MRESFRHRQFTPFLTFVINHYTAITTVFFGYIQQPFCCIIASVQDDVFDTFA